MRWDAGGIRGLWGGQAALLCKRCSRALHQLSCSSLTLMDRSQIPRKRVGGSSAIRLRRASTATWDGDAGRDRDGDAGRDRDGDAGRDRDGVGDGVG